MMDNCNVNIICMLRQNMSDRKYKIKANRIITYTVLTFVAHQDEHGRILFRNKLGVEGKHNIVLEKSNHEDIISANVPVHHMMIMDVIELKLPYG